MKVTITSQTKFAGVNFTCRLIPHEIITGELSSVMPLSRHQLARLAKLGAYDGCPVYVSWPRGCYYGHINTVDWLIEFKEMK